MSEDLGAAIAVAVGLLLLRLGVTSAHLRYVRPQMAIPLVLAGSVFTGLGLLGLLRWARTKASSPAAPRHSHSHSHSGPGDDADGHDHSRVAWLLLLPIIVVFAIAPPSLGSFAAGRSSGQVAAARGPLRLPAMRDGAYDLTVTDVVARARSGAYQLDGLAVRLIGFVAPPGTPGDGFLLSRFTIVCCAADARPSQLVVRGIEELPARDRWVEVVGHLRLRGDQLSLQGETLRVIPEPRDPYESA